MKRMNTETVIKVLYIIKDLVTQKNPSLFAGWVFTKSKGNIWELVYPMSETSHYCAISFVSTEDAFHEDVAYKEDHLYNFAYKPGKVLYKFTNTKTHLNDGSGESSYVDISSLSEEKLFQISVSDPESKVLVCEIYKKLHECNFPFEFRLFWENFNSFVVENKPLLSERGIDVQDLFI